MTLVEIILSIGLVSIVMVQVLNLLISLKNEQLLGEDKTNDLANRSIIVRTVQKDFTTKSIKSINKCNAGSTVFLGADNQYTIKSCLKILFDGTAEATKPRFLLTARDKYNEHDYFIYGYANTSSASLPETNCYEAWKLSIGKYPMIKNNSCGFLFNAFPVSTSQSSGFSRFIQITYPVKLDEAVSNTMMNFDLEFIYYFRGSNSDILTATSGGVEPSLKNAGSCDVENELEY